MKIKVGNKIFDGELEPVMVILTIQDKLNICNMLPKNNKYCCYPKHWNADDIEKFMEMSDE